MTPILHPIVLVLCHKFSSFNNQALSLKCNSHRKHDRHINFSLHQQYQNKHNVIGKLISLPKHSELKHKYTLQIFAQIKKDSFLYTTMKDRVLTNWIKETHQVEVVFYYKRVSFFLKRVIRGLLQLVTGLQYPYMRLYKWCIKWNLTILRWFIIFCKSHAYLNINN